ncbi:4Fe-4S dicluster domain-containing protein [uncultured Desulfosarcina sp.]|uniref:4Fe-4S dicluster domain-containing protein n=1 Tax=uncultured Desulfosarcina sp. TaxID=218289 RepID=UPI0029C72A05|nr:4Fe-4S dicluster domain-containing protein [uncultured Desulfosarcina sp.]
MNPHPATPLPTTDDDILALDRVRSMVSACIQCGTCTGSCPNALEMDLTPRKMWRLVIMGRLADVMASRSFILCSDCYTCTLRCPRGLPLTEAMEALKGIAFARREARHRSSRLFYEKFIQTVQRYGRIREMAFMTRYFMAMKSPVAPFRFAPLGLKLMGKGKVEMGPGRSAATPLTALFEKVADLERTPTQPHKKEVHG